ncbi:DUF4238 domain-containing protein [Burkholderia multivorans]|uniref:DUF4238 domain-containing protein n=1 Tax=Burkholderia multivorans TaxID=87883 RepID=UPI0013DE9A87|nr:DUF4238 domain-containing protein [Burkholderia multivorans]MBU9618504.1 DUF4238 domain-containing protein [Burkholderia multivorans]NGM75373.1 DUF4238 domain-containing protein [Burkholderia multivorans]
MYTQKKNNQHYVGKAHLKNWQVSRVGKNLALWTHNKDNGNIFPVTDLNAVGQINNFYAVFVDRDILDTLEYRYAEHMDDPFVCMTMEQLRLLYFVHDYREQRLDGHDKLDIIGNNYLENQYEKFETKYGRTIDGIVNCSGALEEHLKIDTLGKYLDLLGFFFLQYARTFAARKALLAYVESVHLVRKSGELKLNDLQVEVVVKIMLFIDAIRNASEAQTSNVCITIGLNKSGIDLVSSSTPAILESGTEGGSIHQDGFLALSPKLAMFVSRNASTRRTLNLRHIETEKEIVVLNRVTLSNSDRDVYSTSKEQLDLLVASHSDPQDQLPDGARP